MNTLTIPEWLKTLEITEICQWDVLVFLHRHRNTLLSADQIARLTCYGTAPVIMALERLDFLGMVERSRLSQGARLYRVIGFDGPRAHAFRELMALTESRAGRLAMAEKLLQLGGRNAKVVELNVGRPAGHTVRFRNRESRAVGRGVKQ